MPDNLNPSDCNLNPNDCNCDQVEILIKENEELRKNVNFLNLHLRFICGEITENEYCSEIEENKEKYVNSESFSRSQISEFNNKK